MCCTITLSEIRISDQVIVHTQIFEQNPLDLVIQHIYSLHGGSNLNDRSAHQRNIVGPNEKMLVKTVVLSFIGFQ